MGKNFVYRLLTGIAALGIMLLPACNFFGLGATPTVETGLIYTQAAQTIVAQLTDAAPTATLELTTPAPAEQVPTGSAPPGTPTPSATPLPTFTPTVTAMPAVVASITPHPREIFRDDFSSEDWHTEQNDRFSFEYVNGAYRITVDILSAPIWSVRSQSLEDVRLEVDAARQAGPEDGYFGLVCRHTDGENYYALVIGSDGAYGIARMQAGEFEFLSEGQAPEGAIRPGEAINHIRADCIGPRLTLSANGVQLVSVEEGAFSEGEVGLIAGTRMKEGIQVDFDNFVIIQP